MYNLKFQAMYNPEVITIIEGLKDGTISHESFHNKKKYAKRSKNLHKLLNLVVAWELYKYG